KGKVKGQFQASGLIPKFVETLKAKGIPLPRGLFGSSPAPASAGAASGSPAVGAAGVAAGMSPRPASAPNRDSKSPTQGAAPRSVRPPGAPSRPGLNPQKIPVRTPPGGKK
ncbi:MAG: hypothetical protein ACO3LE_10445, partial [Bdellovibrionota bacterium]